MGRMRGSTERILAFPFVPRSLWKHLKLQILDGRVSQTTVSTITVQKRCRGYPRIAGKPVTEHLGGMLQLQATRDWRFDQQGRPPISLLRQIPHIVFHRGKPDDRHVGLYALGRAPCSVAYGFGPVSNIREYGLLLITRKRWPVKIVAVFFRPSVAEPV